MDTYNRVVIFDRKMLVLSLSLNEHGEPVITNIRNLDELSIEEQKAALGILGKSSGEFEITPMTQK